KSALLAVLAGLGALNHFRNVPAASLSLRGLRRTGSVELIVAATVVLLSATLVNLAPPSEVAASNTRPSPTPTTTAAPIVVTGNDFGTSVRVRLQVTQATNGFDDFRAIVTDYDTGAVVNATGLTLRFSLPARTDIGTSRLDLTAAGPGTFTGSGGNLSIAGRWDVTAVVVNGVSSVEVPLVVTTPSTQPGATPTPGPTIDVNAVEGLPTIYTVHLSAGRTVQVYADPGTAGPNELHATFFDAAGTELPIQTVTFGLTDATGRVITVTPRMLEPGHFVTDTTLVTGAYTFSISAPAPGGDQLTTALDLPITK
ncbi:MAG TPA: CopD family protein, partial [Candidatus Acidoferrum sp.]|nr:CopD family protein [Candidatus Acidoferrum sp.]